MQWKCPQLSVLKAAIMLCTDTLGGLCRKCRSHMRPHAELWQMRTMHLKSGRPSPHMREASRHTVCDDATGPKPTSSHRPNAASQLLHCGHPCTAQHFFFGSNASLPDKAAAHSERGPYCHIALKPIFMHKCTTGLHCYLSYGFWVAMYRIMSVT